jgi:hypothetical protein
VGWPVGWLVGWPVTGPGWSVVPGCGEVRAPLGRVERVPDAVGGTDFDVAFPISPGVEVSPSVG